MSAATESPDADAPATSEAHDAHEHPSDMVYVWIALILAAFTAIEIALYYIDVGGAEVPALLTLMVVKFVIVAGYFMHLKFDGKIATRMFAVGLVLALAVYIAALSTFAFWA
jgi:cytochrome c oxidase subunit IV